MDENYSTMLTRIMTMYDCYMRATTLRWTNGRTERGRRLLGRWGKLRRISPLVPRVSRKMRDSGDAVELTHFVVLE